MYRYITEMRYGYITEGSDELKRNLGIKLLLDALYLIIYYNNII